MSHLLRYICSILTAEHVFREDSMAKNSQAALHAAAKNKAKKTNTLRGVVQGLALLLFAVMTVTGKLQLWFIVFAAAGLAGSVFFGRIYCGWICPMGSLMRAQSWIYTKLRIQRWKIPSLLKGKTGSVMRWGFLFLFLGLMVMVQRQGKPVPVLLYLTAAAVIVSLFFEEAFWHTRICPFGTLLSVSSRASKRGIHVDQAVCISCGKCEQVCPTHSMHAAPVEQLSDQSTDQSTDERTDLKRKKPRPKRINTANECLVCTQCGTVCPVSAIQYEKK